MQWNVSVNLGGDMCRRLFPAGVFASKLCQTGGGSRPWQDRLVLLAFAGQRLHIQTVSLYGIFCSLGWKAASSCVNPRCCCCWFRTSFIQKIKIIKKNCFWNMRLPCSGRCSKVAKIMLLLWVQPALLLEREGAWVGKVATRSPTSLKNVPRRLVKRCVRINAESLRGFFRPMSFSFFTCLLSYVADEILNVCADFTLL